ncbi:hypothetical protein [Eudoraea chungangensis]|uniref:hypothetical protein n=1 Tax=Eudoraea chungangensis TaxID=1481905 RepID=UPI0023ED65A4|nr:hypothetical protein [Eudoraea chungangensis]
MSEEKLIKIKEAEITNNCPECFNQDMTLSFFQKHLYTTFYHKITNDISHQLLCNTCNSLIYPVNWTEDIERIFEYYQKMLSPEPKKTVYSWVFYLLLFIPIVLIGILAYLLNAGII